MRGGTVVTTAVIALFAVLGPADATSASTTHVDGRSAPAVTRSGSHLVLDGRPFRFGAANEYWLGLDENVGGIAYPTDFRISDGLLTAKDMGATVVRSHTLGISTGLPQSLEPALDQFNSAAFRTIDYSIAQAGRLGLHLIVPLTDNWAWYHGGRHDFTDWLGLPEDAFYTDPRAISAFENYIGHLLDHVNPYTGVALKDDPTIMAWELGNELNGMTGSWIDTISSYLKRLSPHHLVSANQQSGINPASLTAPDVDIVDVHYYPPSTTKIETDAATVAAAHKVYVAGEYGSTSASGALLSPLVSDPNVAGTAFWSLFPHRDDHGYVQHDDGFTLHYPGDTPAMRQQADAIRAFDYAMAGVRGPAPPVPAPGRPLITSVAATSTGTAIAWRGATTAGSYTVQRSTHGPTGRWTTVCDRCASDNDTPWTDPAPPPGGAWYRVIPYTLEGRPGPASTVAR